ncbi:MAG: hypothetical protein ACREMY_00515, partial [bacterium]
MEEEAVPFDPNKRFHAHHLVEPHRSHVLMDVRAAAHELGLGAERVAKYVLAGVEAHDEPPGSLLSLLREAATHFPAEDALGMLEHENPRTLRWRIVMMRVLSSRGFPLYSRDELAGLLEAAVVHLNENHDALIAHGHPRTRLVRSSWLHVRVSWLYPVKTPEDARFTPREDGHVEYEYSWGETEKVDVDEDERVRARRIYELSYEDAALHYGLSYADAARLEGLRPKVFDLKARILHQLARALRGGQSEGLEHRCLDLICDVLTYEDSEFLLNQDGELLNFGSRTRVEIEDEHPTGMPRSVTGGLSNLLELIGHCEIELQNGTHHETKGELVALVRDGGLGTLKDLLGPDGYWAALGTTWRAELDGVLDRFWERHRRGWPYFGKPFEFRVTERFEKDLRRTVTLEHKVRAEHASTFERLLRGVG